MGSEKQSFWKPFLITLTLYLAFRIARYMLRLYLGVASVLMGTSLLPVVSVLTFALYIVGAVVTVRKWGNIYAFPAGILVVELARDIRLGIKSINAVEYISESAESVSWLEEKILTVMEAIGVAGRVMYIGYCLTNTVVFFAMLLGLTALIRLIFNAVDKKKANQ